MQAHNQAKGRPRPANWKEALQRAYALRQTAHELDPDHEAPAWQAEQRFSPKGRDTHEEFLAFYREQLKEQLG